MELTTLLYVSDLSPAAPIDVVGAITKLARTQNARSDVTGLLVFDGESFAQLVEGPRAAIDALLGKLTADPRHRFIEVLANAPTRGVRRFAGWQLGYLFIDGDERGIPGLRGRRGAEALFAFDALLPNLDVDTAVREPGLVR